jgi:DNA-binding transcriptional LysR family regulator
MHLERLRHFVKVAHSPTLSSAAKEIHITQSALSRSLQRLEEELEVELFEKRGRSLHLSPAGQALLPQAQEILDRCERVAWDVKRTHERGIFDVRLGVVDSVACSLMPRALSALQKAHPQLHPSLQTERSVALLSAVEADHLDAAVVAWSGKPSREAKRIGRYDLRVYGRKDRFAQLAQCTRPEDFQHLPQVGLRPGLGGQMPLEENGAPRSWVSNVSTVKSLIVAGTAVGYLPNYVVSAAERKSLVVARVPHDPLCALFVLVNPAFSSKGQRAVIQELAARLRAALKAR